MSADELAACLLFKVGRWASLVNVVLTSGSKYVTSRARDSICMRHRYATMAT